MNVEEFRICVFASGRGSNLQAIIDAIDRNELKGSIDLIGHGNEIFGAEKGTQILSQRSMRPDLSPDENIPDDTRLWAVLQNISGGTWGGCVYDVDTIIKALLDYT